MVIRRSHVRVLRKQDVHPVPQLLLFSEQQRRAQVSYPFMTSLVILLQHSEPEHEELPLQLCTTQKTTREARRRWRGLGNVNIMTPVPAACRPSLNIYILLSTEMHPTL